MFQCVFRLLEHGGTEFLLQSKDKQSQDEWTAAIAEVIRKLEVIEDVDQVRIL